MHWTDIDHSFCEAAINGLPEYYNAVSSLFISGFGIYGMMNKYNELFVDVLYTNLIIVGFGSFGYHWYGNIGWGLFDEIPMILAIFTGIIYADNVYYLAHRKTCEQYASLQTYMIVRKKIKLLVYLFSMTLITILNVMSNYRKWFPTVFACAAGYLYYKIFMLLRLMSASAKHSVASKAYYSLATIALSGIIWITTEVSCNSIHHPVFLVGHPLWHFFIGHGFYNLIQVVYFIKINDGTYHLRYNSMYLLYRFPVAIHKIDT